MKHIEFRAYLRKEFSLSREIKQYILSRVKDMEVLDIGSMEVKESGFDGKIDSVGMCFIKDIMGFTILFIYNILHDNRSIRKEYLYKIDARIKIDFKGKKLQIYYYIDDEIFGIVVGKEFQNIRAFIKACFPIIAKSEFRMEFRFFPISRK